MNETKDRMKDVVDAAGAAKAEAGTTPTSNRNREGWLTQVGEAIASLFPRGALASPWRITCGWPSVHATSARARRVGECHSLESSKGRVHEIFISPVLDDSLEVAGTVAHELAHVAAGLKAGHGKVFVAVCKRVGLTSGSAKAVMPGPLLAEKIKNILRQMPPYPHTALQPAGRKKAEAGRGASVSLVCSDDACGCRVSIASRWVEQADFMPRCGCGATFERRR